MRKLTIIRGIPGVGKTTLAQKLGCLHISTDMWFCRDGNYEFDFGRIQSAHMWCECMVQRAMEMDTPHIAVANTFKTQKEMATYFRNAAFYKYDVEIIELAKEYGSVHNVPEEIMERARSRYVPNDKLVDLDKLNVKITLSTYS